MDEQRRLDIAGLGGRLPNARGSRLPRVARLKVNNRRLRTGAYPISRFGTLDV